MVHSGKGKAKILWWNVHFNSCRHRLFPFIWNLASPRICTFNLFLFKFAFQKALLISQFAQFVLNRQRKQFSQTEPV